jgi:hypothetical protein
MRIVYDYAGQLPRPHALPVADGKRGESVIVLRLAKGDEYRGTSPSGRTGKSGGGFGPLVDEAGFTDSARSRDRSVKNHENTHLSVLGPYAASVVLYDTRTAPDGETIAVGGKIAVDLSEVSGDPEATLRKARTILNAASAPGSPSAADMRVAADAYRLMQKAQADTKVSEFA